VAILDRVTPWRLRTIRPGRRNGTPAEPRNGHKERKLSPKCGVKSVTKVPGRPANPSEVGWKWIASQRRSRIACFRLSQSTRGTPCHGSKAATCPQEILHAGIEEEAQEDLARVAQRHDERHQQAACPADLQMSEMFPVDLCWFTGQAAQTQIRLGLRPRPVAGDQVAEVIGAATIAACTP
jgi:hypothetical protein